MKQFVTCEVDGASLCLPIEAVQEVHAIGQITPLRCAPEYIAGLLNLRGHVVTMIDLGRRIGCELHSAKRSQNIVLKSHEALRRAGLLEDSFESDAQQDVIGLAVDRVGDVIEAPDDVFDAVPANLHSVHAAFICGVVRLENAIYPIVNVAAVLECGGVPASTCA